MKTLRSRWAIYVAGAALAFGAGTLRALGAPTTIPLTLAVDAGEVTRGIVHVRESMPVSPGPFTLVYPKWIPGEHAPNGPILNLATIVVSAGGRTIPWTRDLVDMYAFHLSVPPSTHSLDVSFDYLGADAGQYSSARLATPNLLSLTWNKVVLYPSGHDVSTVEVSPSLKLPGAAWEYATALDTLSHQGANVVFKPVTLEMLVDSPLDAGLNHRSWRLGSIEGAPVELDAFADTPAELDASDKTIAKLSFLVQEMRALYRARHFNHYTFLLTCSDVMPGEGVEHHQSSDDGDEGDYLTDDVAFAGGGDLLPHEFNHSWDGKYRRPADLATPNFQVPMEDDLLWVYEGMTQFYGELQAERSGIWTKERWLQSLAGTYAYYDDEPGRMTRPLVDTATSGPFLYGAPRAWGRQRRGVDFYAESALMWLEADVTIRRLSDGKKSLDDVASAFFGAPNTGPIIVPYTRADVIVAMNAVQPYDWREFFEKWIDRVAPHPPNPFEGNGWRVAYRAKPTEFDKEDIARRHGFDASYSLGISGRSDGTIADVIQGSPAAKAGIGPGSKLVAIDGRAADDDLQQDLDVALTRAERGDGVVRLLLVSGRVYRDVAVADRTGPRYPVLERVSTEPDGLSTIAEYRRPRGV
ncbi:MAG: M61 family peptidase [Candidatus Baltobacteraceae bacterium]